MVNWGAEGHKYRICWVADSVDIRGGGFKRFSLWLKYLDPEKFHITFVYASNNHGDVYRRKLGEFQNLTLVNLQRMKSKKQLFIPGMMQLYRWIISNRTEFDVVHLLSHLADIIAIPAFRLAGKKNKYISMTGGPKFPLRSRTKRALYKRVHSLVKDQIDLYLTVSEHDRRELVDYYNIPAEKTRVHRIGVDLEHLRRNGRLPREKSEAVKFGFAGRFSPEKGIAYFLDAIALVVESCRGVARRPRFLIAGEGPLEGDLLRYVTLKKLNREVEFVGWKEDIATFLRMIDVLVVPSLWEGTPRIIIEAAGVGVPSIATKVGGIPETIKDRITGILVPCMDPVALRDAIEYLGENRKEIERLGKNAREFVECEWEVKRSVSLLADTYLEVIGSSSAARGTSSATNGFQD